MSVALVVDAIVFRREIAAVLGRVTAKIPVAAVLENLPIAGFPVFFGIYEPEQVAEPNLVTTEPVKLFRMYPIKRVISVICVNKTATPPRHYLRQET